MAREPASRCDAVTAAIAAGDPVDPAHLAGCAACRARAELAGVLTAFGGGSVGGGLRADPRALTAAVRIRRARGAGLVGVALAALVLFAVLGRAPSAPAPDLLAVLDDAERVTEAEALPGEDLLALLDPGGLDPLDEPLEDALLGDWSP